MDDLPEAQFLLALTDFGASTVGAVAASRAWLLGPDEADRIAGSLPPPSSELLMSPEQVAAALAAVNSVGHICTHDHPPTPATAGDGPQTTLYVHGVAPTTDDPRPLMVVEIGDRDTGQPLARVWLNPDRMLQLADHIRDQVTAYRAALRDSAAN